jgi:putative ABC transport system ATP-binding protein
MPVIFAGTVKENLLIGCRLAEKEEPGADAVQAIMSRVGLEKEISADAARLSGGEKQRVALARVMLMEPEVMLLDEPSASLDEETEVLIFDLVTEFCCERCKTLIMVTHSEKGFTGYYDTLIRIRDGRVDEVAHERGR